MTRAANIDLPARILDEAERVVISDGYQRINMRRLANSVGVSATAIYHYYESKEAILRKLRIRAAEKLNDRIRRIDSTVAPHAFLHELGREYLAHALENPNLYRLQFEAPFDKRAEAEDHPVLYFTYLAARGALEKMEQRGIITGDPKHHAMAGWMMLHGFCSLMMSGLLPLAEGMSRESLEELFMRYYTGAPDAGASGG
ncbi:MAG TPA: TetR/AcrR family transcriptional regulator [Spirochaetia bacterium]|nr:TetR/AcrR family transcriptional regulator [Spirochaetia bacterium]